ncbi:MAG: tetratricopeptide repeat protein [bacterium]
MKKFILLFVFLFPVFAYSAPEPTPRALFDLIKKSNSMRYNIGFLENAITPVDYSMRLNTTNFYRVETEDKITINEFQVSDSAKYYYNLAESEYQSKNLDKARFYYLKALKVQPDYYYVQKYVGQTYSFENNIDLAIFWYEKAIQNNSMDYMAHWFLADSYFQKREEKKALSEIIMAKILDRNNKLIDKSLNKILLDKRMDTTTWLFTPQYELKVISDREVTVSIDSDWMIYGMAKAATVYQVPLIDAFGEDTSDFNIPQQGYCLLVMCQGYLNTKKGGKTKDRTHALYSEITLAKLEKAVKKDFLLEFIYFEIILPKHPDFVYTLPTKELEKIQEYLIKVRYDK